MSTTTNSEILKYIFLILGRELVTRILFLLIYLMHRTLSTMKASNSSSVEQVERILKILLKLYLFSKYVTLYNYFSK